MAKGGRGGKAGIKATGIKQLKKGLLTFPTLFHRNIGLALDMAGELVVNAAKGTSAFTDRTSKLRQSIQHARANATTEVVWPGMEYGVYVEKGFAGPAKTVRVNPSNDGEVPGHQRRALAIPTPHGLIFRKTSRIVPRKPRPFMVPALTDSTPKINALFRSLVTFTLAQAGI